MLDKLTYAGRRENLEGVEHTLIEGAIEDPVDGARGDGGRRRGGQLRRRVARGPLDRGPGPVRDDARDRHRHAAGGRPRARRSAATCRCPPTRSTARSTPARSPRPRRWTPPRPTRATKAGGDLLVSAHAHTHGIEAVICRGSQQLRPAPVPREADPADGAQRHPRRLAAHLRRRPPGAQLALRRGLRPRDRAGAGEGPPRPGLQRRRPRRVREHRGRAPHPRADRQGRVADRVRDRPQGPRPPLQPLVLRNSSDELGWEAQTHFAEGLEQTVQWYRDNEWWWGPIRSGEYRAYYEQQYGKALG